MGNAQICGEQIQRDNINNYIEITATFFCENVTQNMNLKHW